MFNDYQPIITAPLNGTLINLLDTNNRVAFCRGFYKNGKWLELNFKSEQHPTHWKPCK